MEDRFPKEVEHILSEILDDMQNILDNIIYLHDMTGWTYEEMLDKVSKNVDYYGLTGHMRLFIKEGRL